MSLSASPSAPAPKDTSMTPDRPPLSFLAHVRIVLFKELVDAVRDRRTLLRMLVPAVMMGPLMLAALSGLIASLEERAEKRELMVAGLEHAPTLENYLLRQTYTLKTAPADYEQKLRATQLLEPVLVIGKDFEQQLLEGERPTVEVVSDSANQRAQVAVGSVQRLLRGFNQERAGLHLALRGVSPELLQSVDIEERDLASAQARATRITSIVPMFIIMAVLYGALTAALDSTAGERERGSLEPLLMNPASPMALVMGKWGAVALSGIAVAALANLSFLPAQYLIQSDSLQAMFQFGWGEALRCLAVQLPLAAGVGALLMAMAVRTKTFKEAQASATLAMTLISLAPMVGLMNPGGEADWYYWVPGLAQNTLMLQVLKGEGLTLAKWLPSVLVCGAMTIAGLLFIARSMRLAVAR